MEWATLGSGRADGEGAVHTLINRLHLRLVMGAREVVGRAWSSGGRICKVDKLHRLASGFLHAVEWREWWDLANSPGFGTLTQTRPPLRRLVHAKHPVKCPAEHPYISLANARSAARSH